MNYMYFWHLYTWTQMSILLYVTNNICETMSPFEMPRMFACLLLLFFSWKKVPFVLFFSQSKTWKTGAKTSKW